MAATLSIGPWGFLSSILVIGAGALAAESSALDALQLSQGFPRPIFFRQELQLSRLKPAEAAAAIQRFDAFSIKLFREAPRVDYRALIPLVAQAKKEKPAMVGLVHIDHFAAVRPGEGARLSPGKTFPPCEPLKLFPGHWLYFPPTKLAGPIDPQTTTLKVADPKVFSLADDVRLVPPGADQRPALWRESEVVFVEQIDAAAGTITVKRGQYETPARAFTAGALAAPLCKMQYGNPAWYWTYNLSPQCPRDEQGLTFGEWFADWVANEIKAVNQQYGYRVIDGVEFDVTKFCLTFGTQALEGTLSAREGRKRDGGPAADAPRREPDTNLDGVPDSGYDQGVPVHGFGTIASIKRLRDNLGAGYLITGDSIWTLWRPWEYANGMDNESFPDIGKSFRWSAAFERLADWMARAREPRMSFIYTRAKQDMFPETANEFQAARQGLAVATLLGGWHCVAEVPAENWLDEYDGGTLKQMHWLGQPLADWQRLPRPADANLIAYGGFETSAEAQSVRIKAAPGYRLEKSLAHQTEARHGAGCLKISVLSLPRQPKIPLAQEARVTLPFPVKRGKEYTMEFWARAEHDYAKGESACRDVPWGLVVSLFSGKGGRPNTGQHALLIPKDWRRFHIAVTALPGEAPSEFCLEVGAEPGTLWLDDVTIYEGNPNVFYRCYDGGLVLINGTAAPAQFALQQIEPKRTLRRLKATQTAAGQWQSDAKVNTGGAVDKTQPLTLSAFDALFLIAR